MNKKGNLNMLLELALFVAVLVIVSVLVFQLNEDARQDYITGDAGCNSTDTSLCGSHGWNATQDGDTALSKITSNLDLVALAVVFGAVIFVILRVIPRVSSGSLGSGF